MIHNEIETMADCVVYLLWWISYFECNLYAKAHTYIVVFSRWKVEKILNQEPTLLFTLLTQRISILIKTWVAILRWVNPHAYISFFPPLTYQLVCENILRILLGVENVKLLSSVISCELIEEMSAV
jgi:hypothetical protein